MIRNSVRAAVGLLSHNGCFARAVVSRSTAGNQWVFSRWQSSTSSQSSQIVKAVVDDVQSDLDKESHVFVATGQYCDQKEMDRVVVSTMKSSPVSALQSANDLRKLRPFILFDGYLSPQGVDELQEKLSKLNCTLYLGEVDAVRANSPLIGFTHSPSVAVVPQRCAEVPLREDDLWQWLAVSRDSILLCAMPRPKTGQDQEDALEDSSDATIPRTAYVRSETRSIPMSLIADVQIQVESISWEFAELQLRLINGEVITVLRMNLNGVMEELIDTEAFEENGGEDGDDSYTAKTTASSSSARVSKTSEPASSGEDRELGQLENIFDTDLDDEDISTVDFATGRVNPDLAIVMSTEWMVKLAGRICLACHQNKHPVSLRLPNVLRADSNKWVEFRNEMWLASRRAPVA
eukprot:scpid63456/ scgid8041/ 